MQSVCAGLVVALMLLGPGASVAPGAERHLIYLHGAIVQLQQSARPEHPRFGHYELEAILQAFRDRGFVVAGGIRPKEASVDAAARQVVRQVGGLLAAGVPADRVSVVGASMGAGIALLASTRLQEPGIRFAVLGACLSENVRRLVAEEGKGPSGRVLSIREGSDDFTEPCPAWRDAGSPSSLVVREMVLETGLAHGFLYRPLPQWLDPVVEWLVAP